jgi:hypothetical protein
MAGSAMMEVELQQIIDPKSGREIGMGEVVTPRDPAIT